MKKATIDLAYGGNIFGYGWMMESEIDESDPNLNITKYKSFILPDGFHRAESESGTMEWYDADGNHQELSEIKTMACFVGTKVTMLKGVKEKMI